LKGREKEIKAGEMEIGAGTELGMEIELEMTSFQKMSSLKIVSRSPQRLGVDEVGGDGGNSSWSITTVINLQ
jgi:hypothetical protein